MPRTPRDLADRMLALRRQAKATLGSRARPSLSPENKPVRRQGLSRSLAGGCVHERSRVLARASRQ
jgi:hypothetical protein